MKIKIITSIFFILTATILISFFSRAGNIDAEETSWKDFPVKVHLSGITEGESVTYYVDDSSPQTVSTSRILLKLKAGSHTICASSSEGKWGGAEFNVDATTYIKDIYVELSPDNKPCKNFK